MVTENNFYWYEKVQAHLVGNFGLYFPESFIVCTTQINLLGLDICQMEREFHDFYEIWLFDQFEGTGRGFFKFWFVWFNQMWMFVIQACTDKIFFFWELWPVLT